MKPSTRKIIGKLALPLLSALSIAPSLEAKRPNFQNICGGNRVIHQAIMEQMAPGTDCRKVPNAALKDVRALNLRGKGLKKLHPGAFAKVPNLEILDLGENEINRVYPQLFKNLKNLHTLYLDNNNLAYFFYKNDERYMPNLRSLSLANNKRFSKYGIDVNAFEGMPGLTRIDLSGCDLTGIPEGMLKYTPELKFLDLGNNRLRKLVSGMVSGHSNLEELYVDGNEIRGLRNGVFDGMHALQVLSLSYNEITGIERNVFAENTNLIVLLLGDNDIVAFHPQIFAHQSQLIFLWLKGNRFKSFDAGFFSSMPSLSYINLANNRLTFKTRSPYLAEMAQLDNLYLVDFRGNGLSETRDLEQIKDTFQSEYFDFKFFPQERTTTTKGETL